MQRGVGFNLTISSDRMDANDSSNTTYAFRNDYNPAIKLEVDAAEYEVALIGVRTWFSAYNIDDDVYFNNTFRYFNGAVYRDVVITPGNYSAPDLVAMLASILTSHSDVPANLKWVLNYNTGKFEIVIANGYKIDFTGYNIRTIFGAASTEYAASSVMPLVGDITNGLNEYVVIVEGLVNGYGQGTSLSGALCQFRPYGKPSGPIEYRPTFENAICMRQLHQIESLRVRLVDQRLRPVNLHGQPLAVTLHIRPMYKL